MNRMTFVIKQQLTMCFEQVYFQRDGKNKFCKINSKFIVKKQKPEKFNSSGKTQNKNAANAEQAGSKVYYCCFFPVQIVATCWRKVSAGAAVSTKIDRSRDSFKIINIKLIL